MSVMILTEDNCFSCYDRKEAVMAIMCSLKTLAQTPITEETKPSTNILLYSKS